MSVDIDQIALHQLIKRDEQTLELVLRDSLLPSPAAVSEMMEELHRVYSAKSKAFGLFNEESELADALRNCRKGENDFLAFSRAASARLAPAASSSSRLWVGTSVARERRPGA